MESTDAATIDAEIVAPTAESSADAVSFRDSRWRAWTIWVALAALAAMKCLSLLGPGILQYFPWWLVLIGTLAATEAFLLLFPILTRHPRSFSFRRPAVPQALLEFGIAILMVLMTVLSLGVASFLIGLLAPGKSLTPEAITQMAASPNLWLTGVMLVASFTIVPIAEEVFFRGFLQNALQARMPLLLAALIQSVVFGVVHFYGPLHIGLVIAIGAMLTLIYQWRKTLVTPILVHAGFNFYSAMGIVALMVVNANAPMLGVVCEPTPGACVVKEVMPGSPAETSGIRAGDTITAVDGEPIAEFPKLLETIRQYRAGDTVTITVERDGVPLEIEVRLVSRKSLAP